MYIIVEQAPRTAKMQRILCPDLQPKRVKWSDTRDCRFEVQAGAESFLSQNIFCDGKKKTKILMSFKNTFCHKNRQTQGKKTQADVILLQFGQGGWILASFSFCAFMERDKVVAIRQFQSGIGFYHLSATLSPEGLKTFL